MQATIKKLKSAKKSPAEALENALSELPNNLGNFITSQLKLHGEKKQGGRYSPELKSLAISIYHASGKAYRLFSKLFILPTKSSHASVHVQNANSARFFTGSVQHN